MGDDLSPIVCCGRIERVKKCPRQLKAANEIKSLDFHRVPICRRAVTNYFKPHLYPGRSEMGLWGSPGRRVPRPMTVKNFLSGFAHSLLKTYPKNNHRVQLLVVQVNPDVLTARTLYSEQIELNIGVQSFRTFHTET